MNNLLLILAVIFSYILGLWILKIILRKVFSIHITSPFAFTLWFVLSIILGVILYTCFTEGFSSFFGDKAFSNTRGGSIGAFSILVLLWFGMLWGSFEKIRYGRKPSSSMSEKVQHKTCDLYKQALEKNDFRQLCELVSFFDLDRKIFYDKTSKQANEILEGTKYLLQHLETKGPVLIFTKEELEEYTPEEIDCQYNTDLTSVCIALCVMYKIGFGCPVDFNKAFEYLQKAGTFYQKALNNASKEDLKDYQKSLENIKKEVEELKRQARL